MSTIELGTRCAWCTRVKDGDTWVEERAAQAPGASVELLWSHGICPECVTSCGFASLPRGGDGFVVPEVRTL